MALFVEKEKEFTTLKKIYCASLTCRRFLGSQQSRNLFGNVITCPASGCQARTCGSCRAKVAPDTWHTCIIDEKDEQVLALSKDAGWARYPGCDQMLGCYYITCLCKTEFCCLYTARWKTCACAQWDERRLFATAEARVDVQYGAVVRVTVCRAPARRASEVLYNVKDSTLQVAQANTMIGQNLLLRPAPPCPEYSSHFSSSSSGNSAQQYRNHQYSDSTTSTSHATIDTRGS